MKKRKLLFYASSVFLLMAFTSQGLIAQSSIVAEGDVKINDGTTVKTGDITVASSGSLDNNGILVVSGNVEVDGTTTASSTSEMTLNGTAVQTISGTAGLNVYAVTFNNSAGFTVNTSVAIAGMSTFTDGILTVDAAESVDFLAGSSYSGASNSAHVDGIVTKAGATDFIFPIGDDGLLNPIEIAGISAASTYSARYFKQAPPDNTNLDAGLANISSGEYWDFNRTVGTGTVNATFHYNDGTVSGVTDPATMVMAWYNATPQWQSQGQDTFTGTTTSGTLTLNGLDEFGDYTFGDIGAYNLDLTAFLEGPYNTTNSNMDITLNTNGVVPGAQPYNTAPWNYAGTESFSSIPANAVDWVLIEIRDGTDNTLVLDTKAALIMQDGSIRNADNELLKYVPSGAAGSLHFVIDHRNHLPVISANATTEVAGTYAYDFTTAATQAAGAVSEVETGVFAMIAGDIDANNDINTADHQIWKTNNGISLQYLTSDINMNADINTTDHQIWKTNNGNSVLLP